MAEECNRAFRASSELVTPGCVTEANLRVEFRPRVSDYKLVKVDAAVKDRSEAELLDQATSQLLKAVKQKMLKKQGRVHYAKLRKEGYSDRFLARLEEA